MADEWSDYFDELFQDPEADRQQLEDLLFGNQLDVDQHAQDLFRQSFFEGNDEAYAEMVDYLNERYGIDFEDAFSWEDFRGWIEENSE